MSRRPIAATARALALVAAFVLLGGCQYFGAAGIAANQAVKSKMAFNDAKAGLLLKGVCAISIGSYYRVLNRMERAAVSDLCGGERLGG